MDNFRDSYFQVDWDLTAKRLRGTYWGKQYDTGRGFAVTVINGGQVVAPTTEVLRLKWEKPDNTTGYVNATIVNGKFIVENIDQMFTVHGSVRADFELSVGGKFVASITFYVNVEKAVAVDAVASSSQFTALQDAVATVDSVDAQLAQKITQGIGGVTDADLSQEVKEQMTGGSVAIVGENTVLEGNIVDKQVTPRKTSFIEIYKNMFNKETVLEGYTTGSGGVQVVSSGSCLSEFIEVELNTDYAFSNVEKVNYYDTNKNSLGSAFPAAMENNSVNTGSGRRYFRLTVLKKNVHVAQLEKGSAPTRYEPFGGRLGRFIDLPSERLDPISLEKLDFLKRSSNLYNKNTTTENITINSLGEELPSELENAASDYIKVKPNTTYITKHSFSVAFYSQDKVFDTRHDVFDTFTTKENTHYVRIRMENRFVDAEQLNEGDVLLSYEEYYYWFDDRLINPNQQTAGNEPSPTPSEEKTYYFAPEPIPSTYRSMPDKNYIKFETANSYITAFNDLASNNANYVTETLMGPDSSGDYNIYQYSLKPQNVEASRLRKDLPKIVIACGLHGSEKSSIYSMYYLARDLCENWRDNPALEYLRWNFELVFIPLANPWGFDGGHIRHNFNGVDLNRNFSEYWELGTPGEATYGGTEPFSEIETQYLKSMIDSNTDALYIGDYHTIGGGGDSYDTLMWHALTVGPYLDEVAEIAGSYLIGKMTREFVKNYGLPESGSPFGYISYGNAEGSAKVYIRSKGVSSGTFECFRKFPTETEYETEINVRACTEYVANFILILLNHFKTNY